MKKKTISILIAILLLLAVVIPASAITDGELDGEGHPHVVLLLMDVGGEPAYRCTGTLLSPTVLLTAGHCTSNYPDEPYTGMRIYTESDIDAGDGITNDYSGGTCNLGNCYEAVFWAAHPQYETGAFIYHDVGIVILEEPGYQLDEYGVLPGLNLLDDLETGKNFGAKFTSVGYGLQASYPDGAPGETQADRVRMVAYPFLINTTGFVNPFAMLLSNNNSTGGTCFGDSGGPNFLEDTNIVAGVTSFGMNERCAGTGGVYRMDNAEVQEFLCEYGVVACPQVD